MTGLAVTSLAVMGLTAVVWAQNNGFSIQIASAPSEAEARTIVTDLKAKGVEAYWVKADVPGKGTRYRVRIGRFNHQSEAKSLADQAIKNGLFSEYIIVNYDALPNNATPPPSGIRAFLKEAKEAKTNQAKLDKKQADKEASSDEGQPPEKAAAAIPPAAGATRERSVTSVKPPVPPELPTLAPTLAEDKKVELKNDGKRYLALTAPDPRRGINQGKPPAPPEKKRTQETVAVAVEPEKPSSGAPAPRPEKPSSGAPAPRPEKPSSGAPALQPDLAANSSATPTNLDPAIASPPVADAIVDFAVTNSSWKVVRRSTATDKNLRALHFVDEMTGWAAGDAGAVYRTTDGGRSWKPLLSGDSADLNFVYFTDWNNGWMLGEAAEKGAKDDGGVETVFFSTNNGGRTWTHKPLPNVLSLHFTDAKNGWAVGKNATMLKTSDGGEQWTQVSGIEKLIGLPVESSTYNFGFRDVFFLDPIHGWIVGNFYGRARSNIGGLFVTTDGGQTFKRIPLTLQTQHSSGRFTPGELHSVHFTDTNTGSVTGEMWDGEGRFFFALHTRDGGKTWQQYRTPSRAVHSTQFLNPLNGWMAASAPREGGAEAVVHDTALMHTDNGGMSWQNDLVTRGSRIRGVFFVSPGRGWAVGDRGIILRYEEKLLARP